MKSDSELQKLRYDNKELREASDRFCSRIKALEQIKVIQGKLLADRDRRAEKLEAALLPAKNTLNAVRILMKNQDRREHEQRIYEAVQICCEAMDAALALEQDK